MSITDDQKQKYLKIHRSDGRLFEDVITQIYKLWCRPGDVVIDGGANHGHHTFQLADIVGVSGSVLAVEAVPTMCVDLENVAKKTSRPQVKVVCGALAAQPGAAEFFHRQSMDGWSSLYADHVPPNTDGADVQRFITPLVTIDMLEDFLPKCTFMKLDLELNEFPALRGAQNIISRHKPLIIFENSRQRAANIAGYTKEEFYEFFNEIGYSVFDIFLEELTPDRWGDQNIPVYNIAVNKEDEAAVKGLPVETMMREAVSASKRK